VKASLLAILLAVALVACQATLDNKVVVDTGSSRAEVQEQLGEPARVQVFQLPEAPFVGPQESLTDLIPPGTWVEEWVYAMGKEELYVWFAGEESQSQDEWLVIETGRYPVGAVY
jgi:hypothetical protein